jgi:hypothetical protein
LIQVRSLLFMAFNEVIDSRSLGSLVKDGSWFIRIVLLKRWLISWLLLRILTILLRLLVASLLRVIISSLLRVLILKLAITIALIVYIVEVGRVRVWKEIIDILLLVHLLLQSICFFYSQKIIKIIRSA